MPAPSTFPMSIDYRDFSLPNYQVRVRNTMFLWGSAGVAQNITFQNPLLLHIHNDLFGEPIELGTQKSNGSQTVIGTLQPGECVSVPIQGICGVFATCAGESTVGCLIRTAT